MTAPAKPPTMDDVTALEAELAARRRELDEQRSLGDQAAREARETLADEALDRQVRAEAKVRALEGKVADLEAQITADRPAALRAAAAERLKAISRAYGSLYHEFQRDVERVRADARTLVLSLATLQDRRRSLRVLPLEKEQVAVRFDLPMPDLPRDLPPVHLDELFAALGEAQTDGSHDGGRWLTPREARRLIAGTPGAKLIAEAGPTEEERRDAEERARREAERKANEAKEMVRFGPAAQEAAAMKGLPLTRF